MSTDEYKVMRQCIYLMGRDTEGRKIVCGKVEDLFSKEWLPYTQAFGYGWYLRSGNISSSYCPEHRELMMKEISDLEKQLKEDAA